MKKALLLCALGAATAVLAARPAHADTFQFSFTGTFNVSGEPGYLFGGTGYFDATEIGATDKYTITNVYDGSVGDDLGDSWAIAGILAPGAYQGNDNILIYPPDLFGTRFFDHDGVSFSLVGGIDINLNDTLGFENSVGGEDGFNVTQLDLVDVSPATPPAATPEPSSLALLGTAILGAAGALRRRFVA